MRINRLDLTRFGKFTDQRIDFGEAVAGVPDLHFLYGPNEAGKSTTLAAFLDVLYGIDGRSRYSFLHPYPNMLIGASLEIQGVSHELSRLKRPQNSLLDGAGRPIPETVILSELGGIDREAYRLMFSLDDDSLESGGEGILASKGDLGQLLFSASAGLSDLSAAIQAVRTDADGFYRLRAHSGDLLSLKAKLAELKAERERLDTFASEFAKLSEAHGRLAAEYEALNARRAETSARLENIQRHLNAVPRWIALQGLRAQLAPLAGLADAPAEWGSLIADLQKKETEISTRQDEHAAEMQEVQTALEQATVDEAVLALAGDLDRMTELRARHVTAEKDLPRKRQELQEGAAELRALLVRLGRPADAEPRRLVLGPALLGPLRELIESRSGLDSAATAAERELADARERLAIAKTGLESHAPLAVSSTENGLRSLRAAVTGLRADDSLARLRLARRELAELEADLDHHLARMHPWTGNAAELAALRPPTAAQMSQWKQELAEAERDLGVRRSALETESAEHQRLVAEVAALRTVAGVLSPQETAARRAEREQAWADHRRTLDAASAELFEVAMRADDLAVNGRLEQAQNVARLDQTARALAVAEAAQERCGASMQRAEGRVKAVWSQIAGAIAAMTDRLPVDMPLPVFDQWLAEYQKACDTLQRQTKAGRDAEAATADATAARTRLVQSLTVAGIAFDAEADKDQLLALAEKSLEDAVALSSARNKLAECTGEVERRVAADGTAKAALQAWTTQWQTACQATWLAEDGALPTLSVVREILVALPHLNPALDKQDGLADRIRKMEEGQQSFYEAVADMVRKLGKDIGRDDAKAAFDEIAESIRVAKEAAVEKRAASQRLASLQAAAANLTKALERQNERAAPILERLACVSLDEAAARMRDLERRAALQDRMREAGQEIAVGMGMADIVTAEAALSAVDSAVLEIEASELHGLVSDLERHSHDLYAERSRAADRLAAIGGDDAVARIEERRHTVLQEIEERARRYLRLRTGGIAAEHALRLYRERHRSSMLARASDAFRLMSRGAYTGLAAQPGRDRETLVALGAGGISKIASELSRGTRYQLYLALRVAGYHEFIRSRRPLPFLADDIMESFDEFRAEESIKLLAEMAQHGQVIYLTHHRHLCDIAREVCPTTRFHDFSIH